MTKTKKGFSQPQNLPTIESFKHLGNKVEEKLENVTEAEREIEKDETTKEAIKTKEESPKDSEVEEGIGALSVKTNAQRLNFTTSLTEETHKKIKKMSLALDVNINDIVENCIGIAFKMNEKEIQRLIRKKLL